MFFDFRWKEHRVRGNFFQENVSSSQKSESLGKILVKIFVKIWTKTFVFAKDFKKMFVKIWNFRKIYFPLIFALSLSSCHILAFLPFLSCPGWPVRPTCSDRAISVSPVPLSCPRCLVIHTVLSQTSFRGFLLPVVMSQLPVLAAMFCLSCHLFPVLAIHTVNCAGNHCC